MRSIVRADFEVRGQDRFNKRPHSSHEFLRSGPSSFPALPVTFSGFSRPYPSGMTGPVWKPFLTPIVALLRLRARNSHHARRTGKKAKKFYHKRSPLRLVPNFRLTNTHLELTHLSSNS